MDAHRLIQNLRVRAAMALAQTGAAIRSSRAAHEDLEAMLGDIDAYMEDLDDGDVTRPPDPPPARDPVLTLPPWSETGAPTMWVDPSGWTRGDGSGTQLVNRPLADALRHARPGDVIQVAGPHLEPLFIGGGNKHGAGTVYWENGPVRDVAIIGGTIQYPAVLGPISFASDLGGFGRLRFEDVEIQNDGVARAPLFVSQGLNGFGFIELHRFRLTSRPGATTYGGHGKKWGFHASGPGVQVDARDGEITSSEEHAKYLENSANSVDPSRPAVVLHKVETEGNGRTGFQLVNRGETGKPGTGGVLLQECVVRGSTGAAGGGADFTIAGHHGPVVLRACRSWGTQTGSFTANADGHGLLLNPLGFTTDLLVLEDFIADGWDGRPIQTTRAHLAFTGCERILIRGGFDVHGNRLAFDGAVAGRSTQYGGGVPNGEVVWQLDGHEGPLSSYAGFRGAQKVGYFDGARQVFLSDADVDALAAAPRSL